MGKSSTGHVKFSSGHYNEPFDRCPYFECCLSFFLFNLNIMAITMIILFIANPCLKPVPCDSQN